MATEEFGPYQLETSTGPFRRPRVLITAVIPTTLVVAGIIGLLAWNNRPPGTPTVIGTFAVGDGPRAVAVSPDGRRAYTTHPEADSVTVIDTGVR